MNYVLRWKKKKKMTTYDQGDSEDWQALIYRTREYKSKQQRGALASTSRVVMRTWYGESSGGSRAARARAQGPLIRNHPPTQKGNT